MICIQLIYCKVQQLHFIKFLIKHLGSWKHIIIQYWAILDDYLSPSPLDNLKQYPSVSVWIVTLVCYELQSLTFVTLDDKINRFL